MLAVDLTTSGVTWHIRLGHADKVDLPYGCLNSWVFSVRPSLMIFVQLEHLVVALLDS